MPRLVSLTLAFALQLRKKHGKTSVDDDDDDDDDMLMLMLVEIRPFKLHVARLTAALLKPLAEKQPKVTYSFHCSVYT